MPQEIRPRRTKIVATIGPASRSPEVLEALIRAGLDVARLNFSHGTHDDHRKTYALVRAAEAKVGRPIAVMQDLSGPKIRLGLLPGEVFLPAGEEVLLSSRDDFTGSRERIPTTYAHLARDVAPGERVLLADGRLELRALATEGDDVRCRIVVGGVVSSKKGLNLPGSQLSIAALTEKDLRDVELGVELGVDYVALSFVRSPHDVLLLKSHLERLGRPIAVISKIEKPQAVERLEAIVEVSDGIMVARGDLGVELPPEQVPTVQRAAIRLARDHGKVAVVATQMLMSMTKNPRPTHAEVSDVANAVFDGTDAVMLSEETAAGSFPVKAVETMAALAHAAEEAPEAYEAPNLVKPLRTSHAGAIARAAAVMAGEMGAEAVISFTHRGLGPSLIANWRPRCVVIGCASTESEVRRMSMYWGVRPLRIAAPSSIEELVASVERAAIDQGLLSPGATVVITSKMPFVEGQATNVLKLHTVSAVSAAR
ncbi:pyruvate kinase [Myxococcota bacterium]|nr:pyruvate kinase [Myxococcota bacterium]